MAAFQRQLQSRNSRLHIFFISYFDVMLKRNKFLWIFLSNHFDEKDKLTELVLNFIQKQYLAKKPIFHSS